MHHCQLAVSKWNQSTLGKLFVCVFGAQKVCAAADRDHTIKALASRPFGIARDMRHVKTQAQHRQHSSGSTPWYVCLYSFLTCLQTLHKVGGIQDLQ